VIADNTFDEIGGGRVAGFAIAIVVAGFLLLQAAFRSWRLAALVLATLPVALVGGVLAALVTGAELSLGSLLGLLAVFTLAVRGAVVLVSDLQPLQPGLDESRGELVRRGAAERMSPTITTYLAITLLVLPLAVMGGRPGLELLHPLAVVLIGGMLTTSVTTLFLLPAFYQHLASPAQQGLLLSDIEWEDRGIAPEPLVGAGVGLPEQRTGPVTELEPEGPVR